jgi:hypothetical protein
LRMVKAQHGLPGIPRPNSPAAPRRMVLLLERRLPR